MRRVKMYVDASKTSNGIDMRITSDRHEQKIHEKMAQTEHKLVGKKYSYSLTNNHPTYMAKKVKCFVLVHMEHKFFN